MRRFLRRSVQSLHEICQCLVLAAFILFALMFLVALAVELFEAALILLVMIGASLLALIFMGLPTQHRRRAYR